MPKPTVKPLPSDLKVRKRKLSDYKQLAQNANKGTVRGLALHEQSIDQFGAARSAVADVNDVFLAGNHTAEQLFAAGIEDVIEVETNGKQFVVVKRSDLDANSERGKAYSVYDNRVGELNLSWDATALQGLLNEGLDLSKLFDDDELAVLLADVSDGPTTDPGAQMDKAAELQQKWQVQRGDLWIIGKHRLLCGDSTNADDVARVMAGGCAEMVWTDPPYGVGIGDKNKMLNAIAPSNRVEENLENDTLDEAGITALLSKAFDNAIKHCTAGAGWYVAAPPGPLHVLFGLVLKERGIWRQTLQWVKNNATFSPMGVCYHWQSEPIFFGWLPNGGHRYYGGRTQTTVWEIDRPVASPEHPTMKPTELVVRAIENSSLRSQIVYDPFSGSGTTLVACEQTARLGRAIEIEPKYVSVALERLSLMGLSPIKAEA